MSNREKSFSIRKLLTIIGIVIASVCLPPAVSLFTPEISAGAAIAQSSTDRAQQRQEAIQRRAEFLRQRAAQSDRLRRRLYYQQIRAEQIRAREEAVRAKRRKRIIHRRLKARAIARTERGLRVRQGEILGLNLSADQRKAVRRMGYKIVDRKKFPRLGLKLSIITHAENKDTEDALAELRANAFGGKFELNHLYNRSAVEPDMVSEFQSSVPNTAQRVKSIGFIDTAIDDDLPMFSMSTVVQHNLGRHSEIVPQWHGTTVAAIAVNHLSQDGYTADLYVADVFSGSDGAWGDALSIAFALNWLAQSETQIINMSLAGPPNSILEIVIEKMINEGFIIVAAVGNTGSDAAPLYPAAYEGVIGVTAIDAEGQVYEYANQGDKVDFAALGVGVGADAGSNDTTVSGTSFAAPVVAAHIASAFENEEFLVSGILMANLVQDAVDLGEPGHDTVFGHGALAFEPRELK